MKWIIAERVIAQRLKPKFLCVDDGTAESRALPGLAESVKDPEAAATSASLEKQKPPALS